MISMFSHLPSFLFQSVSLSYQDGGHPISSFRVLHSEQAAAQQLSQTLQLNYEQLFKIQRVRNPFSLRAVSYSALASYLECPWCMLMRKRKRAPKEPAHYPIMQQTSLFGPGLPDARAIGTLLHTLINLLHTSNGSLPKEKQELLLVEPELLARFIRHDFHAVLQQEGKISLALALQDLHYDARMLSTALIEPMLRYQRELSNTDAQVFGVAERFQLKLSSTRNTFTGHSGRGGYVGLIGEFDQIRLRQVQEASSSRGTPAIIEFKKSLGWKSKEEEKTDNNTSALAQDTVQPTESHAMQLMIYWLAFQTLWDTEEFVRSQKGMLQEIPMRLYQPLELIIYNFYDGNQYQLLPSDHREAVQALIECIFYLDWAMKSGYAFQSPEHNCQRAAPLTEMPEHATQVQVGETQLPAKECYLLAKAAFERFKATIRWERCAYSTQKQTM